jgi:hypothetical protein
MTSPPRSAREEERRLNIRTLVYASVGSATAALVTSRLWIAGTWIAAALTPVIVTLVSELLARPTERIARSLTTDSPALPDPEAPRPDEPARRVAERMRAGAQPDPDAPPAPMVGPRRTYRSEAAQAAPRRRRRIAYGAVLATAALAFGIGILVLTAGELVAGGSAGNSDRRTTLFSGDRERGDRRQTEPERTETQTQTTTETQTQTQTTPSTETTETQPPSTTPPNTAPTEPAPQSETAPTTPTQP